MSKSFYIVPEHRNHLEVRASAADFVRRLDPDGRWKVMISTADSERTLEQNARMWAMLGDIANQVIWHGQRLQPDEWKDMVTAALKRYKVVPGIDGGFVVIGARTSKMSIKQMVEVIEFLFAFGAEHAVKWSDPNKYANYKEALDVNTPITAEAAK